MIYLCTNKQETAPDSVTLSHFFLHDGEYFCLQENKKLKSLSQWKIESNHGISFIDIDVVDMNMVLPLIYNYVQIDRHKIIDDLDSVAYKIVLNNI